MPWRPFIIRLLPWLSAGFSLFILTRINYLYWPYVWPDEALFSSPAAALANGDGFATLVLKGLIPGMEEATLWNSPLFMVLLSGVYLITGESLEVARGLSFCLALLCLGVFHGLTGLLLKPISGESDGGPDQEKSRRNIALIRLVLLLLLTLDLSFSRAANTARMDMLTCLWFLACLYSSIYGYQIRLHAPGRSRFWFFIAGLCTGLAGSSHPIGIILIPVVLIFCLPSLINLFIAGFGGLVAFSGWLIYILRHYELFQLQFLKQLERKRDIFNFWGGDTGGFLKVYSSQYGGSAPVMGAILLLLTLIVCAGILYLLLRPGRRRFDLHARFFAVFLTVLTLVLLASEGWYALYAGPLILLMTAILSLNAADSETDPTNSKKSSGPLYWLLRSVAPLAALFFLGSSFLFTARNLYYQTPVQVQNYNRRVLVEIDGAGCRQVYLRVRPDPYFLLRKHRPEIEALQFIPGKLLPECPPESPACSARFAKDRARLYRRYDELDCFLLDKNDAWEPLLRDYMKGKSFTKTRIQANQPLEDGFLYKRK